MPRQDDKRDEVPPFAAADVWGGEIILDSRRRRMIFLGGLVAFMLFALIATIIAPH